MLTSLFRKKNHRLKRIVFPFICCCLLGTGGCSLAPEYIRPETPIPNNYRGGATKAGEALPEWNIFFTDIPMQRLIRLALENNRDLRVSMLNIEKNRAQYRIQRADILPSINATGNVTRQLQPADISSDGYKEIYRQYSAELGFSAFELDLFGRIRNLTEQSLETYYSVREEARSVRLSLIAETAAAYLQLVSDRELYDLAAATAENRRRNFEQIQNRLNAGTASDLELSQAQTVLDEARVSLASASTRIAQDINALELLMGTSIPADFPEIRKLSDIAPLHDIPEGLPSELLERRPDILAAEHVLKGANANIGAARANFFPRISLTGSFGKISAEYSNLWNGPQTSWNFLPQITLPLFDYGRNTASLAVSETDRDIAVARYEKAIQNAFAEVGNALAQRENIVHQLNAQESLVDASTRSCRHADARYREGISSYIDVLDAERTRFSAQSALISTRLQREINALTLYKVLGGGWDDSTENDRHPERKT